ncbi:MAG: hypothetical protein M3680_17470 [Myxococcota bacterium]|nr:hypothetical protein [Myxococcota bacterium]
MVSAALEERARDLERGVDDVGDLDVLLDELDPAARDPRDVQEIVDEPGQVLDLTLEELLLLGLHAAELHDLERHEHRRERIAQLVAEHREELVLRARGLGEAHVGLAQRAVAELVIDQVTCAACDQIEELEARELDAIRIRPVRREHPYHPPIPRHQRRRLDGADAEVDVRRAIEVRAGERAAGEEHPLAAGEGLDAGGARVDRLAGDRSELGGEPAIGDEPQRVAFDDLDRAVRGAGDRERRIEHGFEQRGELVVTEQARAQLQHVRERLVPGLELGVARLELGDPRDQPHIPMSRHGRRDTTFVPHSRMSPDE